jgi:hypothetical protein
MLKAAPVVPDCACDWLSYSAAWPAVGGVGWAVCAVPRVVNWCSLCSNIVLSRVVMWWLQPYRRPQGGRHAAGELLWVAGMHVRSLEWEEWW